MEIQLPIYPRSKSWSSCYIWWTQARGCISAFSFSSRRNLFRQHWLLIWRPFEYLTPFGAYQCVSLSKVFPMASRGVVARRKCLSSWCTRQMQVQDCVYGFTLISCRVQVSRQPWLLIWRLFEYLASCSVLPFVTLSYLSWRYTSHCVVALELPRTSPLICRSTQAHPTLSIHRFKALLGVFHHKCWCIRL